MRKLSIQEMIPPLLARVSQPVVGQIMFSRVSIDTRTLQPGDLYWALKGTNHNGHDYVKQALQKGACAVVVEENFPLTPEIPAIIVQNSTRALGYFGRWYRLQCEAMIIGVTGSVGKTTTRHLVHTILSQSFSGVQSHKNYNNHWGVPLSLLELKPNHDFGVFELGASVKGEIAHLARILVPEIAIITAIGPAHLESFGTIENIIDTKSELFDILTKSGLAIMSMDDPAYGQVSVRANCRQLTAGWEAGNKIRGFQLPSTPGTTSFRVEQQEFHLPVAGKHYGSQALLGIALALEIGIKASHIAEALAEFKPFSQRGEISHTALGTIIDDSYNSSPLSVRASIETLSTWNTTGYRYLVLGSMMELGPDAARYHEEIGQAAATAGIDFLFTYGPHSKSILTGARQAGFAGGRLGHFENRDALSQFLIGTLSADDVVWIKGSRSMQMDQVVTQLQTAAVQPALLLDAA
jgi:UDP-N-acetylmuramoyl-tripeptide--D-alanyl-D-alanine ligase